MTMKLIEGAIEVLKNYLSENMSAKLGVLDAEYQDFTLDDIQEWHTAELSAIPNYPTVILLGDFTEVSVEGEGWLKAEHGITIVCLATDQDAERLRKRLYRYIRAVVELIKVGRADLGYALVFKRLEYSPLYTKGEGFVSDSRLLITAGIHETTGG